MWIRALVNKYRKTIRRAVFFMFGVLGAAAALLIYLEMLSGDLLLITPKISSQQGISLEPLEDINDEKFMITYECPESSVAEALNKKRDVRLVSTNYTFPFVMGYVVKDGGFFTKSHQEQGLRVVALNEKAAFELFGRVGGGELVIEGLKYRAVGVIDDKDTDNLNVYIPATITQSQPNAFAVRLSEKVSEAYVKNELKQLGVTESYYEFENRMSEAGSGKNTSLVKKSQYP